MAEKLDVIIFGASGYTAKYAVEELNKIPKKNPLKWGIAGRSAEKLKNVLKELETKTGEDLSGIKIIIADVKDEESLKKMTEQTKIIINCCGPYVLLGEPVIKACIATGTHHVDVSSELTFMNRMQLEYHKAAQKKGIYVVNACGFSSVPFDLGIIFLQQIFDGTVNEVETYLEVEGPVNFEAAILRYSTWESAICGLAHKNEPRPICTKLHPEERLPQFKPKQKAKFFIHKSSVIDKWTIPYFGPDNLIAVHSQRYLYDQEKRRPAQVKTYMGVPSLSTIFLLAIFGSMFGILSKFSFGRRLLLTYPRFFSGGLATYEDPAEEKMERIKLALTIVGKGWSKDKALPEPTDQYTEPPNKTTMIKIGGENHVYGATCVMLITCALTVLKEANKMPHNGGVYYPGAAFAKTSLIQKLIENGVTFDLISNSS